ncbi:MAG: type II CRISPR RNA-guided endonuclease Cas9 [Bacteroidaceae bacterium]|nr:type II CRISPR RNA-guided endonuclease Cas9 [Bacteroidaceae bacterium]
MKKILGLDLGVSSIGWALVNEAENSSETSSIIKLGVRVTPFTVDEQQDFEKGKSITTNSDRTLKRGMRRNLQRYKLRRDNLIECLKENNIISDDTPLCENGNRSTFQTYRLRAKAAEEEITLTQLARVLLMINKKRGYKSNRKAKNNDEGSIIDSISIAKELYDNNITPGEYVHRRLEKDKKYIPEFYRSDLQNEFDRIYSTQKAFYPQQLTEDLYNEIYNKNSKATYAILSKHSIIPAENKEADKKRASYRWRSKALKEQQPIEIVAYTLVELNGQINRGSNYLGAIGDRSKMLYFEQMTVGQMLMKQLDENPNTSLKNTVYYRQDYLDEFERIWETQAAFHKELTPELKHEIRDIIIFYQRSLKSQKGLIALCQFERKEIEVSINGHSHKKTIGRRVCPKSSPLFQEFKIWQILNNLIVLNTETSERFPLNLEEKEQLFKELNVRDKLKKNEILKLLYRNHRQLDLNYKEVEGNRTLSKMLDACRTIIVALGYNEQNFAKLDSERIYDIIDRLFGAHNIKSDFLRFDSATDRLEQAPMYKLWHLLYSYTDDKSKSGNQSLIKKIGALTNMNDECAGILAGVTFGDDYGSLSSKAIGNILPHLKEGNRYDVACTYAGYNHSHSQTIDDLKNKIYKERLEQLPRNSLRNPVVEKILNQMINVVNAITTEYGKPDEIRIELARELKSSAKEREKATLAINKATKENEEIKNTLRQEFGIQNPSRNDIIRYKLYSELKDNGYKTLYSDTYIPREELFGQKFNIEHIIPQARLFDDSYSNKTLETNEINIDKGSTTAYDYVTSKYSKERADKYKATVEELYRKDKISKTKRDKLLMCGEDVPEDFISRDLRDTQYIARKAREILEQIVPHVVSTTGKITDRLRQDWGLTDTMQELNWEKYARQGLTEIITDKNGQKTGRIKNWTKRNDHRHHAMDALVIAFTKRRIIQYLNNLNARSDKNSPIYGIEQKEIHRDSHGKLRFKKPFEHFREAAREQLASLLISIKSKNKVVTKNTNNTKAGNKNTNSKKQLTPRGQLHKETIYGSILRYTTTYETVGSKFNAQHIASVADKRYREALLARLHENGNDAKKAFTGKNSLDKSPIYLDSNGTTLPSRVKLVSLEKTYTVRKNIDSKLNLEKVVDKRIKEILTERLKQYNNDATAAFSNLDENPIYLNKEKGIKIKRVTILENLSAPIALHDKRDHRGRIITDHTGNPQPSDYVNSSNNHHVAIYTDHEGKLQESIVSFFEATARAINQQPIIDREYKASEGWQFCFTMKQNEYFVFPNPATGFDPQETDLLNPDNFHLISPNLFRVQAISTKDYWFRHHLETTVDKTKELKDITWKRITALQNLKGIVKVRINHIGKIVHIGE